MRSFSTAAFLLLLCGCALLGESEPEKRKLDSFGCVERDIYPVRIDLNEDKTDDFALGVEYMSNDEENGGEGLTVYVCPAERRGYGTLINKAGVWTAALEKGETIGERVKPYQWQSEPVSFFVLYWTLRGGEPHVSRRGPWANGSEHYLGLKIFEGGSTYYGWARVRVDTAMNAKKRATLKAYAYNPEAGQAIRAGYEK